MTHGDDFVVTGPTNRLADLKNTIAGLYPNKTTVISYGSTDRIKELNRRFQWEQRGVVDQHDTRHVDVLVKHLGLERGNSVQNPAVHDLTEEPKPLVQMQSSQYRSQVARSVFFSQNCADITVIVSELCQQNF